MLKCYDALTARQTLLKRSPIDDMEVPPSVQERITRTFGEALTPAQVVDRILRDVRLRGDTALTEWTERLDGRQAVDFRVSKAEMQAALDSFHQNSVQPWSWLLTASAAFTRPNRSHPG